ncbi:MAG: lactate utilization protein C [Solirubrobacteraceae bacterium]
MSDARSEILGRVRSALADVPPEERADDVPVARDYRRRDEARRSEVLERFEDRVRDYRAGVDRCAPEEVGERVLAACRGWGAKRVIVPPALPSNWRPMDIEVIEDHGAGARELDELDGAITGCAVAIAETGTLVLDGEGVSGRRALTLVPDHHICIVTADQVVGLVPEAIAAVAPAVTQRRAPITFISGGSATSDIELDRVEGVHGPRKLLVLIVAGPDPAGEESPRYAVQA